MAALLARSFVLVVAVLASAAAGGSYRDNVKLRGTPSYTGLPLLKADRGASRYWENIVVTGPIASGSQALERLRSELARVPHVLSVSSPLTARSGAVAPAATTA